MAIRVFLHNPGSELDYLFDFAAVDNSRPRAADQYLETGETITTVHSVTSSSANLVIESYDIVNDGTCVIVMVSGGVDGESYTITCDVSTSIASRRDSRSIILRCEPK